MPTIRVLPDGPQVSVQRTERDTLTYLGAGPLPQETDLVIAIKNIETAWLLFTAQIGIARAMAEHRLVVRGDVTRSMVFARCLNRVEAYLYPQFMARRALRAVPAIPTWQRRARRAVVYLLGVPFGI